jgi:hypothetical protein
VDESTLGSSAALRSGGTAALWLVAAIVAVIVIRVVLD